MSFGQHPYYPQQRRSVVHPTGFAAGAGHFGQHPFATQSPAPQFNFFNHGNDYYPQYEAPSPLAAAPSVSLDDEERAAIAHLRAIQRRKEAERIVREEAERERAIAQLQARREAAIAAKARALQERQREREIALIQAREREAAIALQMREIKAAQQAEAEERRRRYLQQIDAHRAWARQEQLNERRRQCAQHCAARRAEQARQAPSATESQVQAQEDGLEGLNRLIGSLFGIQLDTSATAEAATAEAKKAAETKKAAEAPAAPAPTEIEKQDIEAPAAAAPAADTEDPAEPVLSAAPAAHKPAISAPEQKKAEFPEVINNVLANFLGVRVEPESKLGQAVSNKVPEGLNELLGQFGLEFVPDAVPKTTESGPSEPKQTDANAASASEPAPAPQTAESSRPRYPFDLSDFLKGDNGLPPFVRDILGNVELAFKNEQREQGESKEEEPKGKGKGVAEGEKKANAAASTTTPAATSVLAAAPVEEEQNPTTSNTTSIDKLESIAADVRLARDSFTFPSTLSFSHAAPTENVPSLLFNKQNKPYHAQNNKLLQLLLQADGVASNGDREVRRKRKEVVKLVESELEGLEKKRDEIWRSVKDRRENGNESSDDESSSWTTGSTVDHEDVVHVEDVATAPVEQSKQDSVADTNDSAVNAPQTAQADTTDTNAAPTSSAEAVKSTVEQSEAVEQAAQTAQATAGTQEQLEQSPKDKEEGYELL